MAICWPRSRTKFLICDGVKMTEGQHPAALEHMPWFISGPNEGDPLYVITTVCVIAAIVGLGILFFTLHSLPERLGHKKMQFEVVAVLGLLSLFTHVHAFWVAGLLLALVDLPDLCRAMEAHGDLIGKNVGRRSRLTVVTLVQSRTTPLSETSLPSHHRPPLSHREP